MNKLISLLLALAMVFSLVACGSNPASTSEGSANSTDAKDSSSSESAGEIGDSASSGENAAYMNDEPVYGGTLTIAFSQLSSIYTQEAPDFCTYMLWYESLFGYDWVNEDTIYRTETSLDMTGQLAKDEYDVDYESGTITIYLREDVYFQTLDPEYDYYGGRQLVANDVKWSYDRLLGTGSGFTEPVESMVDWSGLFSMVNSIDTEGDFTVIFNCNNLTEATLDSFIINSGLVHIVGPEYGELTEEQTSDWHYACGTGPFQISDAVDGQYITFVRNENYYDYDEKHPENKLPYLDGLTLVYPGDDSASLMSGFIGGEFDIVGANNANIFSASEMEQIASAMDSSEYWTYAKLGNTRSIALSQGVEALTNYKVRLAMQYAINLDEIATEIYGYESGEWTFCGYFGYDSDWDLDWESPEWADLKAEYTTYDPELARQLLEEAGYGDGFEFTLVYDSGLDTEIYEVVQMYLAQVGITMNLNPEDQSAERRALIQSGGLYVGVCDLGTNGLSNGLSKVDSTDNNYLFSREEELDRLVTDIKNATELEERADACLALSEYYMTQHYSLICSPYEYTTTFCSTDVGGLYHDGKGYNLYMANVCSTILPRIWNVNGAD